MHTCLPIPMCVRVYVCLCVCVWALVSLFIVAFIHISSLIHGFTF